MLKIKSIPLVLLIMALISCENKPKIVEMGDFKEYIDNTLNMGMKYPGNWNVIKEEGKSFYANSMKNGGVCANVIEAIISFSFGSYSL